MHDMIQMDLFSSVLPHKQITKPIRLIECFAGIGSQFKALKQLTDQVESYKIVEWSIHSIKAYNSIHIKDFNDYSKELTKEQLINAVNGVSANYNEPLTIEQLNKKPIEWLQDMYNNIRATHNLINIMNVHGKDLEIVDTDKYEYILTYSFPCQDLSLAGLRKGMDVSQADGGTRSGLLWEIERILDELVRERESLPQMLVMENVPEVIGTANIESFKKWELKLESLGYTNYVKVINAKDFAIPQNRRRCFMISILGDYAYDFPINMKLKYRLKDMLETDVDEKYYLSNKLLNCFLSNGTGKYPRGKRFLQNINRKNQDIGNSITTLAGNRPTDNFILEPISCEVRCDEGIRTFKDNCMGTLRTIDGCGGKAVIENKIVPFGSYYTWKDKKGNINTQCNRAANENDCALTVACAETGNVYENNLRIRKLTPKECYRLMGFQDSDYQACVDIGQSNATIYHQAGDSIVVCVLIALFAPLFNSPSKHKQIITDYVERIQDGQ